MLNPDQLQFIRPDLSGPYAKLARHVTAMYEIIRLAPTNEPSVPGNPSIGLSVRDRAEITKHLRECLEMICTLEKLMMNPALVVKPDAPSEPGRPEDYLDPDLVRKRREMHDRLRTNDDAAESRVTGR